MNLEQLKNVFVKFLVDQELLRRKMVTSRVTNLQKSERVEREKIREETKIRKKQLSDFTWLLYQCTYRVIYPNHPIHSLRN